MNSEAVLDFLKDAVASAPDIPEEDPVPVPKAKRKRYDCRARTPKPYDCRARKHKFVPATFYDVSICMIHVL